MVGSLTRPDIIILDRKLLPFKSLLFACERKLSKTLRLLHQAATGNCPDRLRCVTARLTTAITCDTDRYNFAVDRGQVESLISVDGWL